MSKARLSISFNIDRLESSTGSEVCFAPREPHCWMLVLGAGERNDVMLSRAAADRLGG
jgi:hypothetical protein